MKTERVKEVWAKGRFFLKLMICSGVIAIGLRGLTGVRATVTGHSMEPTYQSGDCLALREDWAILNYQRGDVVVVESEELGVYIVKRIIGLPGDVIELKAVDILGVYLEEVWVNDELLEEPYINSQDIRETMEEVRFEVPEGTIFVMGDNRRTSLDSRDLEQPYIPMKYVMGRVIYEYPEKVCQLLNFN